MSSGFLNISRDGCGREEFLAFWRGLSSDGRTMRALRRAEGIVDCVQIDRFQHLRHGLAGKELRYVLPSLAVAVLVAARIDADDQKSFGRTCADAGVAERRVKTLLKASDPDEVVGAFDRVLGHIGRRVSVADAAWAAYRLAHPSDAMREAAVVRVADCFSGLAD